MLEAASAARGLIVFEEHPVQYRAPLYRHLQQNLGIPVTVIYRTDASISGSRDREFGVDIAWDSDLTSGYDSVFLTKKNGNAESHYCLSSLHNLIKRYHPAAILLIGYHTAFDRIALLSALRSRLKFLFRAETTDHALPRSYLKGQARDILLRRLYSRCSKLLYIGANSKCHYERLGCNGDKLVFAPYCVDPTPFRWQEGARSELRDATRNALGIFPQQQVLLFSGKLSYRKGPDILLEAVNCLPPAIRSNTQIVFMGSGEMLRPLQSQASKLGIADRTHFVGFQNQTGLSPYYHAADLLIMPSRYSETWGLTVNEALQHGLPCVVSDAVGSAPDLIQSGISGEVAKVNSAANLADSILRALPMLHLAETRASCRAIASRYSIETAAQGIASAYSSVVGR